MPMLGVHRREAGPWISFSSVFMIFTYKFLLSILRFREHDTVKITSYKITDYDTDIHRKDSPDIFHKESGR